MLKKPPKSLKKYFQDMDFNKVDACKHRMDIIRRILNYGDEKAVAWMYDNFEKSDMKNALSNLRGYSAKSANYWSFILGVPREKVLCLKRRSLKGQKTIWPY